MSEPRGLSGAENEPAAPAERATSAGPASAEPFEQATSTEPFEQATSTEPFVQATSAEPLEQAGADRQAPHTDADSAPRPFASGDQSRNDLLPSHPSSGAARRRTITIGALVVLGIAGVGGGGTLLALNLTHTTSAGASDGGQAVTTRWQRLQAGQIFPATIQYVSAQNVAQSAHRVGIAPAASCPAGLDSAASDTLAALGCTMVLRATYADQSGALLATVGVAVVASPHAAVTAVGRLAALRPPAGVRPEPFSGTIADLFQDAQRAAFGTPIAAGRYVFFYAAGYADGRPGRAAGNNPDLDSLGRGLVTEVEHVLTSQDTP